MEKLKKRKLWLTAGIPGLGKSTWIQKHKNFFPGKVRVISRDEIRFSLLKEGEDYFSHEKEVWWEYVNKTKAALELSDNVILDATHLNEASRAKILRALGSSLKDVEVNIILFKGSVNTAIKRNNLREGLSYVPESAIRRMSYQVTTPSRNEGFDNIYIVNVDKNDEIIKKEGD